MTKQRFIWSILFIAGFCMLFAGTSLAAVSAEEAKQLGTTLTEFGAEKAGNADGSIPAYTGGLPYRPAGKDRYEDPFKGEKPLYTIDKSNVAKYASLLTPGIRALIARFPTYRVDVYPTHRTMCYTATPELPFSILENSLKNATTAKLAGKVMGDTVTGADKKGLPFAGIPFPIPKNGYEVMWNYHLRFEPAISYMSMEGWLVDAAGRSSTLGNVEMSYCHPWYERSGTIRRLMEDAIFYYSAMTHTPPPNAGIAYFGYYPVDTTKQRQWFYTPGQRRVRRAPEFCYDIPIASYGGVFFWDECFGGFDGRMDRFDFKLAGKKEMIIPYNVFGIANQSTIKEYLGPNHVNTSTVRWEKHRVWVVDATVKAGSRHAYGRRVFYIDEDSWAIALVDCYDSAGKLWRIRQEYLFPAYDAGGINGNTWSMNDVIKGNYIVVNSSFNEPGMFHRAYTDSSDMVADGGSYLYLSPQAMAGSAVR